MWRASVFTLFPAMFPGPLGLSLAGDALARGLWAIETADIRDHGFGRHRAVDDRPAGGGAGMVLRADVVAAALDARLAPDDPRPRLLMSPRGAPLRQADVRRWASGPGVVLLCGRFEGLDERVIAARRLTEVSIGDYVLSGGEIAALAILDACVRLLPGVMGAATSDVEESFENGLLEYPHYTRPRDFEGQAIPDVLLSGDHGRIAAWRQAQSEALTRRRRPDLWADRTSEGHRMTDAPPPFAAPFACTEAGDGLLVVRHRADAHWWRFAVADKNGRLQLIHDAHEPGPGGPAAAERFALDAYDVATLEARRRGWVD
jgi:tRNA (guanine37-N1)-methyltransferase